ncbi:MAG: Gfo/Idh/MocA family oxidoreductase [Lachnospiraceae bacterium]|nr:Gfo/Idh/MocA family oxidoreductase [Lachnospiraceae bacterium]
MNKKVLLVGPGYMGREYCRVLLTQGYTPVVIGRGLESANRFTEETGVPVEWLDLSFALKQIDEIPEHAIVASTEESQADNTVSLIKAGVKNVLLEKPGGMFISDLEKVSKTASEYKANVYIAYNRRFYASTDKALQIIEEDGGVRDAVFEITEWGNIIGDSIKNRSEDIKEAILTNNSSHVIDLFMFFCGEPIDYKCYVKSDPLLTWHKTGCIYVGSGITNKDILFSYHADWNAPGRWGLELLTLKHRIVFRPMEQLKIQNINSIEINNVEIDDTLDKKFKPGLYKQVESFLNDLDDKKKITVHEQIEHMKFFAEMEHKGFR